jgi:hypothetical protein
VRFLKASFSAAQSFVVELSDIAEYLMSAAIAFSALSNPQPGSIRFDLCEGFVAIGDFGENAGSAMTVDNSWLFQIADLGI